LGGHSKSGPRLEGYGTSIESQETSLELRMTPKLMDERWRSEEASEALRDEPQKQQYESLKLRGQQE